VQDTRKSDITTFFEKNREDKVRKKAPCQSRDRVVGQSDKKPHTLILSGTKKWKRLDPECNNGSSSLVKKKVAEKVQEGMDSANM